MLIQTREQFIQARTVLLDSDLTAVDTETAGFDGPIIGISAYCLIKGREPMAMNFYMPFRHEHDKELFSGTENMPVEWLQELRPVFERESAKFIFHNFKFDLKKFWMDGIDVTGVVYDTMLMSWMVNENTSHALKTLASHFYGEDSEHEAKHMKRLTKQLGAWEAVPPDVMGIYAEKDALLTWKLYHTFKPLMEKQELWSLYPKELDFCRLLARMEHRGIRLNIERAKQLSYETRSWLEATQKNLGFDPAKPSQLARKLYGCPPEGAGLLPVGLNKSRLSPPLKLSNGTTIDQRPVMDIGALSQHSGNELAATVLEYRSKQKALSTWFQGFLDKVDEQGRLHTTFKQHGTVTTRLSSSQPNVQQIPRTTEEEQASGLSKAQVKTLFLPEENCELWELDYDQCEFRLAGCYAKEPVIIEGYREGTDFHQLTADLLGIKRQDAKTVNFAILYGAGPRKLAQQLGTSEAEGRQVLDSFHSTYPRLAAISREAEKRARRGWVRYWDGRRRHFQYSSEHYKAFNSIVQGGAARIVIHSMLEVERAGYLPHLQVHDSLWFSIPINKREETIEHIKSIMEWPTEKFPIPFPVDAKRLDKDVSLQTL